MRAPVFTPHEIYCLNHLIAHALYDPDVCRRILSHDTRLIVEFRVPQKVWHYLSQIEATSLQDLCKQLILMEA